MEKKCFVFIAKGFEEVEALTIVDLLRRENISIEMVSITDNRNVVSSHGIEIVVDRVLDEISLDEAKMLIIPGGIPGVPNLKSCDKLSKMLLEFNKRGGMLAAICAGPSVLGELGILSGKNAVCYPGYEEQLLGANVQYDEVVTDGNITTSRGMGTAIELGLELVKILKSESAAKALGKKIVYRQ